MAVMNFCPSCGIPQAGGANFCVGCGYKLDSINVPAPDNVAAPSNASPSGYETRSNVEETMDRAVTYIDNKVRALSLDADFDEHFAACMQTKGYKVPLDILPKMKALAPFFGDKSANGVRDWGIEKGIELGIKAVAGAMLPEVAAFETLLGEWAVGQEIYDHRALEHAAIDCALRAQAGGPGEVLNQMLDAFPVPDVAPALPEMPPAVPVLPPPPANWRPAVIPMEDPAPASPKPPSDSMPIVQQILLAIGIIALCVAGGLVAYGIIQQGGIGGGTYFMHFNCGTSGQCAQANGAATGVLPTSYSTLADCDAAGPQTGFVQQPAGGQAGWFCSTNSDARAVGP
jgi:hypothetical protein